MKKKLFSKLKSFPGNKTFGKKEKGLGSFMIACKDCGTLIDIDKTNCPNKIKKLVKRNMKMRGVALIALEKMNPRCPKCHQAFLEKGGKQKKVSGKDMVGIAEEAAEESKQKE